MTSQINLRLPESIKAMAEKYAKSHGFKNLQELAKAAIQEKLEKENEYDDSFTPKEIDFLDRLLEMSIAKGKLVGKKELMKALE
jgi:Arc/MetJ-type ribon-helix-helix transcriptional regulator